MSSETLVEAGRRRTFAIISHPDAGKTTLTEKFLLYAGAIEAAGAVKARRGGRGVVSDWMELEQQRGISVSSTLLRLEHRDHVLNLLDTPGHRDFSEDTYRVLTAVDAAVMVLDAAKGVEERTRRLFEVCRARGTPLLTFVNKCDRPAPSPLGILDEIELKLSVRPTPVTWPVGLGASFRGVVDRRDGAFFRFHRTSGGATQALEERLDRSRVLDEGAEGLAAFEEVALLDEVGAAIKRASFLSGETTPVFFGSALWNFGVRLLLDAIVDLAPPPGPRPDAAGRPRPLDAPFAGQVFKVQANLDPRHRDRLAFVRVCSGRFDRGMQVEVARTRRAFSTSYAHELFGRDRATLDEAYPGDVVGLVNARDLRLGDTLYAGQAVEFPPIPSFAPEHFATARAVDPSRHKQFRRGLATLEEEGVVQILSNPGNGDPVPVLAAVGPMQYDVTLHRMAREFDAPVDLSPLPYSIARRTDPESALALKGLRYVAVLARTDGTLLALFPNDFWLEQVRKRQPEATLEPLFAG
ncbi:MAG TPA: peptide chain release factor 3 [Longimicrobiaceae bacterium]|nr:peptide chain release factor 3 [Longimicrobiaceae bacterium]